MLLDRMFVLGLVLVLTVSITKGAVWESDVLDDVQGYVRHNMDKNKNSGKNDIARAKNCGDAKHNFTLTWEPDIIIIGSDVTINFDMTPAVDLSTGHTCFTVEIPNVPQPIYQGCTDFKCTDFEHHKLPLPIVLKCPVKKGIEQKISNYKFPLAQVKFPIPAGTYHVKIDIKNQDSEPFICAELDLKLRQPDMDEEDWNRPSYG